MSSEDHGPAQGPQQSSVGNPPAWGDSQPPPLPSATKSQVGLAGGMPPVPPRLQLIAGARPYTDRNSIPESQQEDDAEEAGSLTSRDGTGKNRVTQDRKWNNRHQRYSDMGRIDENDSTTTGPSGGLTSNTQPQQDDALRSSLPRGTNGHANSPASIQVKPSERRSSLDATSSLHSSASSSSLGARHSSLQNEYQEPPRDKKKQLPSVETAFKSPQGSPSNTASTSTPDASSFGNQRQPSSRSPQWSDDENTTPIGGEVTPPSDTDKLEPRDRRRRSIMKLAQERIPLLGNKDGQSPDNDKSGYQGGYGAAASSSRSQPVQTGHSKQPGQTKETGNNKPSAPAKPEQAGQPDQPKQNPIDELWSRLEIILSKTPRYILWGVTLDPYDPNHAPTKVILKKFLKAANGDVATAEQRLLETIVLWNDDRLECTLNPHRRSFPAFYYGLA
ncbi:hypothetical protein B0T22DRAFT_111540 [Podospora appendiculata]|uniref:Phosphatidylinositol transfer protein SFH5 n=1 Tax=Podospora appendiculata TaxID=314037 RepID=A0AAE0XLR5_9PEZI|nr:hypothetical protein B0T22DRAFT_111540 [Podospora appendiculata]